MAAAAAGAMLTAGQASAQAQGGQVLVPKADGDGKLMTPMRRMKNEDRVRAALKAMERRKANEAAGLVKPQKQQPAGSLRGVKGAAAALLDMTLAQVGTPDIYANPNYAVSKLPVASCSVSGNACQKDNDCPGYLPPILLGPDLYAGGETCTGAVQVGTGIAKFVDPLPGLCGPTTPAGANCLPVAVADATIKWGHCSATGAFAPAGASCATNADCTVAGESCVGASDYYEIGLKDYVGQFHRDLAHGTRLRGYYQKNTADPYASVNHYLGPLIVAQTGRPVRVLFRNELGATGAGGDLFIPMDSTLAGAGVDARGNRFSENRATVHLHGGNSPWISDGTQHQWTTPASEPAPTQQRGLSVQFVPDMWFDAAGALIPSCAGQLTCSAAGATNDPGPGALTFYWTNDQSGRLMFYHDHAYGITRLNVMVGEAAGYLLTNPPDEDRLAAAGVPGTLGTTADLAHVIPLVIQDRVFVPPVAPSVGFPTGQLDAQDPTWDTVKWGGEDSIWFPHVYLPNQWPGSPDGTNTNAMGRWDYGPWFWPMQTTLTEVDRFGNPVNRPLTQACTSAAAITAANPTGATICPTTPLPSTTPEAFLDTPVVNGTAYPTKNVDATTYRFQILNASNDRNLNLSFFVADTSRIGPDPGQNGLPTEVRLVPATTHLPTDLVEPLCASTAPISAVTGTPNGPDLGTTAATVCWPRQWPTDNRQGGVPHPLDVGPQMIQIGSEGGLLPTPAFVPPRPVVYEQNKRNIVVLNVADHSLFLGPAERADVVVDFTAFAGKTLILYNDAPAPVPAGDPREDFYTGSPDFTTVGGAPTVLAGYGPNTRTVAQFVVGGVAPSSLNLTAVTTALKDSFVASQPKPVVPEAVFSGFYGPTYTNSYMSIQQLSLNFTPVGEINPTTITFGNKALHELFTTDYGRMNSLLGVEIPNTNWLNQTTIPFANQDPTTEYLPDNLIQMWKITHNGVDTHSIHFHLFNAQVINRVGWDGQIRAPDANELGWKDTVRMNPLEDIILALRPVRQNLPWPLPDVWRPLDVDRCVAGTPGCTGNSQFTGVDVNNLPITVQNTVENFGQEYVWHCHLLGHEEMDMLRAEILVVAPEAPAGLGAAPSPVSISAPQFTLSWTDMSKSALYFNIQRSIDPSFPVGPLTANFTDAASPFVDTSGTVDTTYFYRVQAGKTLTSPALPGTPYTATSQWVGPTAGVSVPAIIQVAPTSLAFTSTLNVTTVAQVITVTNIGTVSVPVTGISISGSYANQFAQNNKCPKSLAAGASCTINVTFKPTSINPAVKNATNLTVAFTAAGSPKTVSLTGTVLYPINSVLPASWNFGTVVRPATSSNVFTVQNTGTAPMTISSVSLNGSNKNQFSLVNGCGASLAAGASCNVTVTFQPTTAGTKNATLNVNVAAPAVNSSVALTGVAQ